MSDNLRHLNNYGDKLETKLAQKYFNIQLDLDRQNNNIGLISKTN